MRLHSDDRTASARIRDEALQLFADRGPDAVTVRDIAGAAGVSPALILRHYGSKDGLRTAVDEYVALVFQRMLEPLTHPAGGVLEPGVPSTLAEAITRHLPPDSPVPGYLGRLLVGGGDVGSALFSRLFDVSRTALAAMVAAGIVDESEDPEMRAAFLLVNDLAVLMLRDRVQAALHVDPLSPTGLQRWSAAVGAVYRDGIGLRSTTDIDNRSIGGSP